MAKKLFSLIVVPHSKGKSKTVTLTEKKVKVLVAIFSFLFIVLTAFLIDYFTMNVTRQKYRELYKENTIQKQTITKYKVSLNKLNMTLQDFEDYAKKLNVMAGLKSPEVLRELGVGGGGRDAGQDLGSQNYGQNIALSHIKNVSQKAENIDSNLNTLMRFFESDTAKWAFTPSVSPVKGWRTSVFGKRKDPFTGKDAFHYGWDIAASYGSPIVATADGIVAQLKKEVIGGNTIIIKHRGMFTTVYCHLSKFNVKVGQKVKRYDVIGFVGQTGKAIGPHVHYEIRINRKAVNPFNYILDMK